MCMQLYLWILDSPKEKESKYYKNKTMNNEIEKADGNIPL